MKTVSIPDFRGGFNPTEPTTLENNEFEILTNFYYDPTKRLRTRLGSDTLGQPAPDGVVLLNALDATTNIAASEDATNLVTGTAIRGTNSVSFDIDVSLAGTNQAIITWTPPATVDITTAKGYISFWLFVPAAFNTNLSNVQFRLGSSASDYYEWTLSTLTQAANNFIVLTFASATTTGTPSDSAIDYFRLVVNYTASYIDKTGVLIDSLYAYSATSTKSQTSYFFFQRDDTLATTALCTVGTNMFLYNETTEYWEVINTGLTEFETATGYTTYKTRWSFVVYKNIVYMCNGIDNYRRWNGTTITEYAGQPKFRYLAYLEDRVCGAGVDLNPSTFYYMNAAAADASTVNANSVVVGGDEMGKINGLFEMAETVMAGKSKKIYSINIAAPWSLPIDSSNGLYCDRAIASVGNSILYFNDQGIDSLKQKSGATGSNAIEYEPFSANLQSLIEDITPKQYNAGCGTYILPLQNYYFQFDSNNDNIPDTTIVYSARIPGIAWTQYSWPNIYEFGYYVDSDGVYHYVGASAVSGQLIELETGITDLGGLAIPTELKTKKWDFGDPQSWKDFQFVDIFGLASEASEIFVEVLVDDEIVSTGTVSGEFIDVTSTATPIGTGPLGSTTIGGGGGPALVDLYPYKIRIPLWSGGQTIQVRIYSTAASTVYTLDRMAITYDDNTFDIFPTANIA